MFHSRQRGRNQGKQGFFHGLRILHCFQAKHAKQLRGQLFFS